MDKQTKKTLVLVLAIFFAYSLGRVYDNVILLADPNPHPITSIWVFGIISFISLAFLSFLIFKK